MSFPAQFPGHCARCNSRIKIGQEINYDRGSKPTHAGKWCPGHEHTAERKALLALNANPHAAPLGADQKRCWECGITFTLVQMQPAGDWGDDYCGCRHPSPLSTLGN